jgi:MFS family permease
LALFLACGLAFATWASRLVVIRETLGVTPGVMGGLLLGMSAGSICAMPTTGTLVVRFGVRRVLAIFGSVMVGGLVGAGVAASAGSVWAMAACLVVFGAGLGATDVAMNLAGSDVERALGRSVMPQFHAGYSVGTVAGAGIGALMSRLGISFVVHFGAASVIVGAGLFWGWCTVLPEDAVGRGQNHRGGGGKTRGKGKGKGAWLEGRILLIGVLVLSMSLAEGAADDWLASGLVQAFGIAESGGIAGLAIFLVAMTAMRTAGTRLVDRWGRVRALRLSAAMAVLGLAIYAFSPWLVLALAGTAVWGLGAALGFPLGMSAAGDDPLRAAQRTSVVATIAYGAFLVGPPVLGGLAGLIGFRLALACLIVPMACATLLAPVLVPRSTPGDGEPDPPA